jgi:hypothetical protein
MEASVNVFYVSDKRGPVDISPVDIEIDLSPLHQDALSLVPHKGAGREHWKGVAARDIDPPPLHQDALALVPHDPRVARARLGEDLGRLARQHRVVVGDRLAVGLRGKR